MHGSFHPHSVCLAGNHLLIWHSVVSDVLISLAYYLLAFALVWIVRQRNIPFKVFFLGFAAFIFCCGLTHSAHVYTMFSTDGFWLQAILNDVTALVSLAVCVCVLYAVPEITNFLRDHAMESGRRAERYQDAHQTLAFASMLQKRVHARAEGMLAGEHSIRR